MGTRRILESQFVVAPIGSAAFGVVAARATNGGEGSLTIAPGRVIRSTTSRMACIRDPVPSPIVAARQAAKPGRSDSRRKGGRGRLRCKIRKVGASGIRKGKLPNITFQIRN